MDGRFGARMLSTPSEWLACTQANRPTKDISSLASSVLTTLSNRNGSEALRLCRKMMATWTNSLSRGTTMSEPISSAAATIQSTRVPAALRSVIVENKLARNDIAILLLILERTLANVFPAKASTALSIRYIAEQNGCSDKGAENSVNKLKKLNLIAHETFPDDPWRPGMMGLNCDRFSTSPQAGIPDASNCTASSFEKDATAVRARLEDEMFAIREMLYSHVNTGRKQRESERPDPFLAALFLDHFGTSSAVEEYLDRLHADAKKRKESIRGYGFYDFKVKKLREAELLKWYVDPIRVTEPMEVPSVPPFSTAGRSRRLRPNRSNMEGWQVEDHARAGLETEVAAELVHCIGT
jgi:hypothetical protein